MDSAGDGDIEKEEVLSAESASQGSETVESVASHMNELAISANHSAVTPPFDLPQSLDSGCSGPDIDKRIRALKKKVKHLLIWLS